MIAGLVILFALTSCGDGPLSDDVVTSSASSSPRAMPSVLSTVAIGDSGQGGSVPTWPHDVAVDQQRGRVYVAVSCSQTQCDSAGRADEVWVLDGVAGTVLNKISVGEACFGLSLTPDGGRLFVACAGDDRIWVLDPTSGSVVRKIAVEKAPHTVAVTPDGSRLLVGYWEETDTVSFVTLDPRSVTTLHLGGRPHEYAFGSDGRLAYVLTTAGIKVIDVDDRSLLETLPIRATSIAYEPKTDALLALGGGRLFIRSLASGDQTSLAAKSDAVIVAVDGEQRFIFLIGGRSIVILDRDSRRPVAKLDVDADLDLAAVDGKRGRLYLGGGPGLIIVGNT